MDGRHLHGRRPGQPRASRGAPLCVQRCQSVCRDHRQDRKCHSRLSVGPGRGWGGGYPIVRQLGGQSGPGAIRAMGDRADRAAGRPIRSASIRMSRLSAFPKAPAASSPLMRGKLGSTPSVSTKPSIRPGRRGNCPMVFPCKAISTRWRLSRAASCSSNRSPESLTRSPIVLTSSISGTGFCRIRRSTMSRNCWHI